ncbi:MAG: molybdopterin-dependent oxidoreductase, partial [Eggerthella lenta]
SKESAYQLTIGATGYSNDFANAKMVMFIGRSYGDGIRPSSVQSLADAAEHGTRVVIVDPRLNNSGIFASDWVPINPGTDLALLMAMANVLIEEDLYDHDFVEQNTYGFEEFAEQAKEYTPEWAEKITDVPAETIQELARSMAKGPGAPSSRVGARSSAVRTRTRSRRRAPSRHQPSAAGARRALITSCRRPGHRDARLRPRPAAKRIGDAEYPRPGQRWHQRGCVAAARG